MIVASLNINKRLGNEKSKIRFVSWLSNNKIDMILAQEPWKKFNESIINIPGYRYVGGNSRVCSWIRNGLNIDDVLMGDIFFQVIKIDYLTLINVYLDAYRVSNRAGQINVIIRHLQEREYQPFILFGDFNIAPEPLDGIHDGRISNFNNSIDRGSLRNFISEFSLVDTTSEKFLNSQEYSIRRKISNKEILFRCDLCLMSALLYSTASINVIYDHSVRDPKNGFTDHSAIIAKLPVSVDLVEPNKNNLIQQNLFDLSDQNSPKKIIYNPYKTAISTNNPSPIARFITDHYLLKEKEKIRILDYGCGRGRDINYYRAKGFMAEGFDPHNSFGFSNRPSGKFDIVTLVFVVNVLPNARERLEVIKSAKSYLKKDGLLFIAARSPKAVNKEAIEKSWETHNDGYWSHKRKGTFQKGISNDELISLCNLLNLQPHGLSPKMLRNSFVTQMVFFEKKNN